MLFARLLPLFGSLVLRRRIGVLALAAAAYEVWRWSRSRRAGDAAAEPAAPAGKTARRRARA
jgi:hypothetical protein